MILITILFVYLILPLLYRSWSERPIYETLLEVIDERDVSRVTFREDSEEITESIELSDQQTDDFVASLEGYDTNDPNDGPVVHTYTFWLWDTPISKQLFGEIEKDTFSLVFAFENGDSETIYFNGSELQIGEDYYTVGYNPLIHLLYE